MEKNWMYGNEAIAEMSKVDRDELVTVCIPAAMIKGFGDFIGAVITDDSEASVHNHDGNLVIDNITVGTVIDCIGWVEEKDKSVEFYPEDSLILAV